MGFTQDFNKPAVGNAIDADLDQIRDNWHMILAVAASGSIVLPGWQTTVQGSDKSQPDSITLTRGTKKIIIYYTWTDESVSAIQFCYDNGVGETSPSVTCYPAIPFYYDDTGNPVGTVMLPVQGALAATEGADTAAASGVLGNTLLINLVEWWPMEENDTARAGSHASISLSKSSGGTLASRTGRVSNAADFRGVSDNCLITTDTAFRFVDDPFTASFWLYRDVADGPWVIGRGRGLTAGSWEWRLRDNSSTLEFIIGNGSATAAWGSTISDATWYHVILYHDPTANEIGIILNDGTPVTASWSGGITTGSPEYELAVGGTNDLTASIDGAIDEVAIWSRVLTAAEITALYNSGSGITYTDL